MQTVPIKVSNAFQRIYEISQQPINLPEF